MEERENPRAVRDSKKTRVDFYFKAKCGEPDARDEAKDGSTQTANRHGRS